MKKLVGYITSSFPSNNFTIDLALSMHENGVDILELGIPFSDPAADGQIIENANLKSLEQGFKLNDLYEISKQIAPKIDTFFMGYMNTFYNQGVDNISKLANSLGIKGAIIPDLPYEEQAAYKDIFSKNNQTLIDFVAPTSPKQRVEKLVTNSKEFIYLVAYLGITGSGKSVDLKETISYIREFSNTPIYVGFGVDENSAKERIKDVDGIIVGSAFVKYLLDDTTTNTQKIKNITQKVKRIKELINE